MHRSIVKNFMLQFFLCSMPIFLTAQTITVKSLSGREVTLEVELSATVEEVKNKVLEKTGIPINHQQMIFSGHLLKNNKVLSDYNIQDFSTIHLVTRVVGGCFSFADVSKANETNMKKCQFSESAPNWRKVKAGLNLLGICSNASCEAFNAEVVWPIGVTDFQLEKTKVFCPQCKKTVIPRNCAYDQCQFRFLSTKKNGEKKTSQWYRADDEDSMLMLDAEEEGYAEFTSLVIQCFDLFTDVKAYENQAACDQLVTKGCVEIKEQTQKQTKEEKRSYTCILL